MHYKSHISISVFLLLLFLPSDSLPDVGSCARYKLNVVLQNGDNITCFIQISDFGIAYITGK